jgi:hypothetical protein
MTDPGEYIVAIFIYIPFVQCVNFDNKYHIDKFRKRLLLIAKNFS